MGIRANHPKANHGKNEQKRNDCTRGRRQHTRPLPQRPTPAQRSRHDFHSGATLPQRVRATASANRKRQTQARPSSGAPLEICSRNIQKSPASINSIMRTALCLLNAMTPGLQQRRTMRRLQLRLWFGCSFRFSCAKKSLDGGDCGAVGLDPAPIVDAQVTAFGIQKGAFDQLPPSLLVSCYKPLPSHRLDAKGWKP